jgi:hypothetical protein
MRCSRFASALLAAGLVVGGGGNAAPTSQQATARAGASGFDAQRLAIRGGTPQTKIDPRLSRRQGPVDVWVSLSDPALAAYKSARLAQLGAEMQTRRSAPEAQGAVASSTLAAERALQGELRSHRAMLLNKQAGAMSALQGLGARELGRVHVAHNALAVTVDASALPTIARLPGVVKVRPVIHYQR